MLQLLTPELPLGLGRALAIELARRGHALLLVASDARDLQAIAADLELRFGAEAATLALDLAREPDPGARILAALAKLPPPSALLLVAGVSREDDDFTLSATSIGELLSINLHAPHAIVHALFPARRDGGGDPKFPALYDWCRGNPALLEPMLKRAGFAETHVQRFWGHGYFDRMPGLKQVDHAFNALAARVGWNFVTTYAYVVVRKGRG